MRYLLVMGFFCDVYRREPLARFYFDDQLIDEFLIQHSTEKDIIYTKHLLDPKSRIEYNQKCLPPLRFYELEINKVSRYANIRIQINNDDNNYMNGFMSKNTLLKFRVLSLLPKDRSVHDWLVRQVRHRNPWIHSKKCNKLLDLTRYVEWRSNNGEKIIHHLFQHIYIGTSGNLHCELIKKYGVFMPKSLTQNTPYLYTVAKKWHDTLYDKYVQYEQYANK